MSPDTILPNINHCTFCYKSIDDHPLTENEHSQKLPNFTNFLQRFCDNSPSLNVDDNLLQACEPCLEIVDAFMAIYNQLKCLELQLLWKMQKLRSVMIYASRAPSRIKQFQEKCNQFKDRDVWMLTKTFRTHLVNLCSKKVKKFPPHVQMNTNPSVAEIKITEKPDEVIPTLSNSSEDTEAPEAGSVSPDYTSLGGHSPQSMLSYAAVSFLSKVHPPLKTFKTPPSNFDAVKIPPRFGLRPKSTVLRKNVGCQVNFIYSSNHDPLDTSGDPPVPIGDNESECSSVVFLAEEMDMDPPIDFTDNMQVTWEVGDEPINPPEIDFTLNIMDTASTVTVLKSQPIFLSRTVAAAAAQKIVKNSVKNKTSLKHKKPPTKHRFKCNKCSKTFEHRSNLLYHVRTRHTQRKEAALNEIKMTPNGLTIHDFCYKISAKYACNLEPKICSEKFFTSAELSLHAKLHGNFKCNFCSLRFSFAITLAEHEIKNHGPRSQKNCSKASFGCPRTTCKFRSLHESKYFEHFLQKHLKLTMNKVKCPICSKIFNAQSATNLQCSVKYHYLAYHDKSAVPPEDIKECDKCPAYFLTQSQLMSHQESCHKTK